MQPVGLLFKVYTYSAGHAHAATNMPITADQERQLLNHYKLTTLYPDTWPHPDNDDDSSTDDDEPAPNVSPPAQQPNKLSVGSRANYSKYRNIDRHASIRSATTLAPNGTVQSDEPDPLGMTASVAAELRRRGVPVEEDLKLRDRFMLSSTSFSPALFLSQVHQDASTEDLLRGLEYLGRSIEQKSASLKVLVESNFEKFVRAKAVIDNVYTEMKTQGQETEPASASGAAVGAAVGAAGRKPHSRHTSRTSMHFRNTSGPFSPTLSKFGRIDHRKNALTKESEYGVLGIKAPLQDVAIKAEEVWGPALGGREKEETLKAVVTALDQHREIFRLSGTLTEAIAKHDYDTVLTSYRSAQKHVTEARALADAARRHNAALSEQEAQQILITAKMHHDVTHQIETCKHDLWRRLKTSHGRKPAAVADETDREEHMELIGVLLQLGVDENPIWEWLNSRSLYLKDRIARSFERVRIEIEISRRGLAGSLNSMDLKTAAAYLRSGTQSEKDADAPPILAFWDKVEASLTALLASPDGLLGEVVEYWETTQSFIDNKSQKSFPRAVFSAGSEHLELEPDDVANLRSGALELFNMLRETTLAFFVDAPVEDLSELYSPVPPTPVTPQSGSTDTPTTNLTPHRSFSFSLDPATIPPPSPKRGDSWEKFAFWPPCANSLSGAHYLSRLLVLVGRGAGEMASVSLLKSTPSSIENLKLLMASVRERCIQALSSAWTTDAEHTPHLESWQRDKERRDLTLFPAAFRGWEEKVLGGFQRMAYLTESSSSRGGDVVVMPPPAKLLQGVRSAFVGGLYKVLSGMVEGAEKGDTSRVGGGEEGLVLVGGVRDDDAAVDASNRVRLPLHTPLGCSVLADLGRTSGSY